MLFTNFCDDKGRTTPENDHNGLIIQAFVSELGCVFLFLHEGFPKEVY